MDWGSECIRLKAKQITNTEKAWNIKTQPVATVTFPDYFLLLGTGGTSRKYELSTWIILFFKYCHINMPQKYHLYVYVWILYTYTELSILSKNESEP